MYQALKHTSQFCQEVYFAAGQQTSRAANYAAAMPRRRKPPAQNFRENLRALLNITGWSNRELSRRAVRETGREAGKPISDRYIGMILDGRHEPTLEMAEVIGAAFGLTCWDMITPNLQYELAKSGRLEKLVANFLHSPPATQDYLLSVAARDAEYEAANDDEEPDDEPPTKPLRSLHERQKPMPGRRGRKHGT